MKKLLFLFAVLLTSVGAWAQTFTLQKSTDEGNPEYQYFIQNANSVFMDSQTSFVSAAKSNSSGKFAFFAYGATENDVLIYSIDANKWVSYTKAGSYDNKTDFVELEENKENANPWRFSENINGHEAVYQFAPHNNGGIATKYWNWYGGTGNTETNKTVGLYSSAANSDNGSAWILWQVNGKRKYYLQDVHNTYLNLSVLGQEPGRETTQNRLATLTLEQAALYVTVASDGRLQIHTEENGGDYLKQSVVDAKCWNSWVSEGADDFFWTQEFSTQNGQRCLVLRNTSGRANGYLGCINHTAGEPLYVDNNTDAKKLKLKMIDGNAEFAHITYKFVYKGQERGMEEYYMPVGSPFPSVLTTFPDYIHCNPVPSGNIDNSCNGKIYEINLYDELPFQVSDSYENAVWYYMNIRSTGNDENKPNKWVEMSNSETYTNRYGTKPTTDEAKWAFIGNPFDGIKVINKDAGANKTLSLNGDKIVMKDEQKVWNLQKGTGGFVLQAEKNTTIYAHDHNGSFKTWNSGSAKTNEGSAFNVIDVRSDALEYATNVILGSRITDLATIRDGQTVVFKSVPHSKYINISTTLETGISSTLSGLSVFKIHVVDAESKKYTFESCKEGYYFPDITQGGAQSCTMEQTNNPNQYTVLSEKFDNTALSEGQFVIKSLGTNGGYFDVQGGNDFCGWQGKGDNCVYEIYSVTALGTTSAGTVNHCVLTDDNNNIYQYDYWALPGTNPTISGIPSSCITNGSMNDKTYTAHVTFPFPASSANQVNPTMISSFKNGYATGYEGTYKWYAGDSGKVKVSRGILPDIANMDTYSWVIYPQFEDGTFSFAIKNLATNKYVYTTDDFTNPNGASGGVTLENTPKYYSLGTDGYLYYLGVNNKINQYLSAEGSGNTDQELGVWAKTHNGATNTFPAISYTVTIPTEGIATLFTPYAVEIPDGVTVKYVEASKNQETTGNIEYTELTGSIPANTAVLLEGFAGTYTFNSTEEDVDALEDNILFGYSENTNVSASEHNANVYNLTYKKGRIAFYEYEGTEYQAYAAYLDVTSLNVQGTPEYFNVVDMSNYFVLQTSVEGWTENNPNTHLGTISLTNGENTVARKMEASALDNYYYKLDKSLNTTLALTRKYRGYEFLGFWLGETELGLTPTLTAEQVNAVNEANPIIAKYKPTDEVTLFYDDDEFSYRIPAIAKTSTGRLIAVSDYRHNLDDVGRDNHGTGTKRVDLVYRYSDDNGQTWSEKKTIVEGRQDYGYGDAAVAVVGNKILVMAVGGNVSFAGGNANNHNRIVYIVGESQEDGDITWAAPVDIADNLFIGAEAEIPNGHMAFFGSGKLAVDTKFIGTPERPRIYGALLVKLEGQTYNNFAVYSDDFGASWKILGGSTTPLANADEPKMEVLPNGQILLSVRRGGGRLFNVFTYGESDDDKANGVGEWNGNQNGCGNGGNSTNGEIFCIDAKKSDNTEVKLLLQSQPKGSSRANVTIWYKEVSANATYTSTDIANDWTEGLQVSYQKSGYSAMTLQEDGRMAFFFEEAPCYGDDHSKGYCMVYAPLSIEQITKSNYFNPNIDLNTEGTINVVLTDAQGNVYRDQVESTIAGVAAALATKYSFITLGDNVSWESDGETLTYTNTVTLPFKVSNENGTYWHNIYYPTALGNQPIYLSASQENDEFVTKHKTDNISYGASTYNTQGNEKMIAWAIFSVNNSFTFKFKNKLTQKFIQVTSVSPNDDSSLEKNVKYVEETQASSFEIIKDAGSRRGDYSLKANVSGTDGYLCSTSADHGFPNHFHRSNHEGSWVIFKEAPDFDALITEANDVLEEASVKVTGEIGMYKRPENLDAALEAMKNPNTVTLNNLVAYSEMLDNPKVQEPIEGTFYRLKNVATNMYLIGNTDGTAKVSNDEGVEKSAVSLFYVDTNRRLLSYNAGRYFDCNAKALASIGTSHTGQFGFAHDVPTPNVITYKNNGKWTYGGHSNGNLNYSSYGASDAGYDWYVEPVTSLPFTFNSAGLGFATFNAPVAVELPEGVLAYVTQINLETNTLQMYRLEGKVVPANTPVMLYCEAAKTEGATKELTIVSTYTGNEFDELDDEISFYGTIAAETYPTNCTIYSLRKSAGKNTVGFYQKADGNLGGFKAWIKITGVNSARTFTIIFDGDDATGLKEALGIENENVEIYDLSGRRLDKPAKGVNVIGGKLVIK